MEQARWLQAGSLLYRSVRVRALSAALQQEAERKSWILEQAWDCRSYQKNSNEAHVHNQMCEEQLRFAFWVWAASQLGLFLVIKAILLEETTTHKTRQLFPSFVFLQLQW